VTSIGNAFSSSKINSITFEEGTKLTAFDSYAFYSCTNLTSFIIPNSITSLGDKLFLNSTSLKKVEFESGTTISKIPQECFKGCTSLETFTIPDSVTTIGKYAFKDCTSISSIIVPSSVTTIGSGAFENWTSSQTINFCVSSKLDGYDSNYLTACYATINWGYTQG